MQDHSQISPLAQIHPSAKVEKNVTIGPYTVVSHNTRIGEGSTLVSNVFIGPWTDLGKNSRVHPFAALGLEPQDLKYAGEETRLIVGDGNTFQSHSTVSRGTTKESRVTTIGHSNLFMAYSHIGHDCKVGDKNIFTNGATLAGHVQVGNSVHVGAFCAIHQFCHVSDFSFVSHAAMITQDVLPYLMISGNRPRACGLNTVGLKRNGFSKETITALQQAYRIIFRENLTTAVALEKLSELVADTPEIERLILAIKQARRGFVR